MTNLMDINYRKEHMMMFYDTKSSIHYGFTPPLFPVWDAWEKTHKNHGIPCFDHGTHREHIKIWCSSISKHGDWTNMTIILMQKT